MKKSILLVLFAFSGSILFAQKKAVNEANSNVNKAQEFRLLQRDAEALELVKKAQTSIDAAILDASTSQKYDTWMTRSIIYSLYGQLDANNASQHYKIALESLNKAYELDNKKSVRFEKINELVSNLGFNYYNLGVTSMNKGEYKDAQISLVNCYDVLNFDNGKLFPQNSVADTVKMNANYYAGICAYYANDYQSSITLLERAIQHPISAGESNAYVTLNNAYAKTNNKAKQLETITKGRAKFPNDNNLATAEINYYIENGELEKVTKKINDELASNPNRDDLYYNLGLINIELINKGMKNEDEEIAQYDKAIANFTKAAQLKSDFRYDYMVGLASFNAGAIFNNRIERISDVKEQEKVEKLRNTYFENAKVQYLKVHQYFTAKDKSKLTNSELSVWQQSLIALKEMAVAYGNQTDYDKYSKLIQEL